MDEVKSFLASKTVWGALIALLPNLAGLFGLTLSAGDAAATGNAIQEIAAAVGALVAIYGRVTATKRIG